MAVYQGYWRSFAELQADLKASYADGTLPFNENELVSASLDITPDGTFPLVIVVEKEGQQLTISSPNHRYGDELPHF